MENMFAPDGYNKDGSSRPWIEVEILEREKSSKGYSDLLKIKTPDGKTAHCYENSLSKVQR